MDIKLIPIGNSGSRFVFPALPEQIQGKSAAKYQNFDVISKGTVKVPKGTDVGEISWNGEFFGVSKRSEAIVRKNDWREPVECVKILNDFIKNETVLNLIVTETWINMDVTISSFQPTVYGAYGNIRYSISFVEKKPLEIYDTNELKIAAFVRKTRPRNSGVSSGAGGNGGSGGGTYVVKKGDTLSGIAQKMCGGAGNWQAIYNANAASIEATAQSRGMSSSDHGHWIFPGMTLTL